MDLINKGFNLIDTLKNKRIIFVFVSVLLLVLWLLLSGITKSMVWQINAIVTSAIFILLGAVSIVIIAPRLSHNVKLFMLSWIVVKILFSVLYFEAVFIDRQGESLEMNKYGDSHFHHLMAEKYYEYWSHNTLLTNPKEVSKHANQWGYDYFLGIMYYITSPRPVTGVIVNSYLALVFCLLCHRLFLLAGLSSKDSCLGMAAVSLSPGLWLLSSYLYKDALLSVIVITCFISILKITKKSKVRYILLLFALLGVLIPIRYSYFFAVNIIFFICLCFSERFVLLQKIKVLFAFFLLLAVVFVLSHRFELFRYDIWDVFNYIQRATNERTMGGHFMVKGLGSTLSLSNFYYVLPARAVYIIMIPFPWFNGTILAEHFEHTFSHFDALYYVALLTSVVMAFFCKTGQPKTRTQKILLLAGIIFFIIPLFMYFPGRRYVSICVPFFAAYSLPIWLKKRNFIISIFISLAIAVVMHILYYSRNFLIS